MKHDRLEHTFATRGQSSTLPLNIRPPTNQRRANTFRSMLLKFKRSKIHSDFFNLCVK